MSRKAAETTIYLGDDLYRQLQGYCQLAPGHPSMSAIVREALRRFLAEAQEPKQLSPAEWVRWTEPIYRQIARRGVGVSTTDILQALDDAREYAGPE